MSSDAESTLEEAPLVSFTARLPADQVEARALALLAQDKALTLLTHLPRPWPERVARAFLSGLRPAFAALLEHAALAIPIELLPASVELPESADSDYSARVYARALEHFQSVAALRRSIAQETAP